jgi:hypothetical protein
MGPGRTPGSMAPYPVRGNPPGYSTQSSVTNSQKASPASGP